MSTTICFDFGNTRLKAAVFKHEQIAKIIRLADDSEQTIKSLIEEYMPDKSILSSVIDHNPAIETILNAKTKFHKLNHLTKPRIHNSGRQT
jgi:type III pantothenate kinase